jgi:hypothetical protein
MENTSRGVQRKGAGQNDMTTQNQTSSKSRSSHGAYTSTMRWHNLKTKGRGSGDASSSARDQPTAPPA